MLLDKRNRQRATLYLDPEHVEAIKRIQAEVANGATQSQVLRFALDRGLLSIEHTNGVQAVFDKRNRQMATLYLDPEHVEAIKRIQAEVANGAPRTEVLRFALDRGLPSIERSIEREAQEAAQKEIEAAQEHWEQVEAGIGNTPPGWARDLAEDESEERTGLRLTELPKEDQVLELYRVIKRAWELVEADEAGAARRDTNVSSG